MCVASCDVNAGLLADDMAYMHTVLPGKYVAVIIIRVSFLCDSNDDRHILACWKCMSTGTVPWAICIYLVVQMRHMYVTVSGQVLSACITAFGSLRLSSVWAVDACKVSGALCVFYYTILWVCMLL